MTSATGHHQDHQYHPYPPPLSRSPSTSSFTSSTAYGNPSSTFIPTQPHPPTFFQNNNQPLQMHSSPSTYHPHSLEPPSASNSISLSINDVFELAQGQQPSRNQPTNNQPTDTSEMNFDEILRGFTGSGPGPAAAGLDFGNSGLDGWPADFGPTASSSRLSTDTTAEGAYGNAFDHLFPRSSGGGLGLAMMSGVVEGGPQPPDFLASAGGPIDFSSSALSSSASPEEQQHHQILASLSGNPSLQNDRVRRLSKQQEPFLARDEFGSRGSFGSGGEVGGVDPSFFDQGEVSALHAPSARAFEVVSDRFAVLCVSSRSSAGRRRKRRRLPRRSLGSCPRGSQRLASHP